MYKRVNWVNHVIERSPKKRLIDENEEEHIVEIYPMNKLIQQGTAQSAENFNHMDSGILDAHLAILIITQAAELGNFPRFYTANEKEIYPLFGLEWVEPTPPPVEDPDDDKKCDCDCCCKCDDEVASAQDIKDLF